MDELAEAITNHNVFSIPYLGDWIISIKITDKEGNLTTFKPNVFQARHPNNFHCRMVVAKAVSWVSPAFMAILALDRAFLISTYSAASPLIKRERWYAILKIWVCVGEQLDPRIKRFSGFKTVTDSKTMMKFSNGSSAKIGTTIPPGTTTSFFHLEFGPLCKVSAEKASTLIKSALPTVPAGKGIIVIESTAGRRANQFETSQKSAKEETERQQHRRKISIH